MMVWIGLYAGQGVDDRVDDDGGGSAVWLWYEYKYIHYVLRRTAEL